MHPRFVVEALYPVSLLLVYLIHILGNFVPTSVLATPLKMYNMFSEGKIHWVETFHTRLKQNIYSCLRKSLIKNVDE